MPSSNPLPPHEANLFKKALRCFEQKQCKKSLQHVKEILKKFPEHGETLSMKGLVLNYYQKKAEAYECAQRGLRNDVKSHVCWHVYGLLQRSDRKYDEAIKCYRNALRCDPENFQILRDLSLLQVQTRDLEGYRDTKYQLLQLRPTQRVSWIGYAMSYHLLKNYEMAINILEEFCKTQQLKNADYETSELILYMNSLYVEAGHYEKALKHLEENKAVILDKLVLEERRGELYLKMNQKEQGAKVYEELIERNPDHIVYYKKLEECRGLSTVEERLDFYKTFSEKYPRSDVPRKLPLEFLTGDLFKQALDKYMQRALHKGVPPLFKKLKYLFADASKLKIAQDLVLGYADNLEKHSVFALDPAASQSQSQEKETPTSLLWVYYYLAQHYDFVKDTERALGYINKAIEHTPTLVELYIVKAKICKHAGDVYEAAKWMDEAQSLDTADRFINYKCSKYMLRANMISEAQDIAGKFTREATQPADYLREMQCMWFEIESANAYKNMNKFGEALKNCHQVDRHFLQMIEDQFDFHLYCMRKMTLSSYVKMLKVEDEIKSHQFYFRAAKLAISTYLRLHDKPLSDDDADKDENLENLTPSELKKLKNKQKKQLLKAQQEKDKQQQMEQKKKELSKQKKDENNDGDVVKEEELQADKLERPENALEECNKFLKPLEKFAAQHLDTHTLGFEVYMRKKRFLLMLRSLKKIKQLEEAQNKPKTKFHYYLCKFLIEFNKLKATLNENVLNVINAELKSVLPTETPVSALNEEFLKKNGSNYECVIEGAKIIVDLKPGDEAARKQALDLLTNLNSNLNKETLNLKLLTQVATLLVLDEYFGKLDQKIVDDVKNKFSSIYPHATIFKTQTDQETDLIKCMAGLSITAAALPAAPADGAAPPAENS